MVRQPDDPHARQADIDRILLSTAGRGKSGEVPRLLREAGIDPTELGITDEPQQATRRIAKLRHEAKLRASGPPSTLEELAVEANRAGREVEHAKAALGAAQARLADILQRLGEAQDQLRGSAGL